MARRGWTGKYVPRIGVGVLARFSRIGSFKRMRGRAWRAKTFRPVASAPTLDYAEFFDEVLRPETESPDAGDVPAGDVNVDDD